MRSIVKTVSRMRREKHKKKAKKIIIKWAVEWRVNTVTGCRVAAV